MLIKFKKEGEYAIKHSYTLYSLAGGIMNEIIAVAKKNINEQLNLPFSIYSSHKEQMINNVPVLKPLLIFILNGKKQLGKSNAVECNSGTFVFLSNSSRVDMRNIPSQEEYFAVLIDFDHEDFSELPQNTAPHIEYIKGEICPVIEKALLQYIEFSSVAPSNVIKHRKREILEILYHSGYVDVCNIDSPPSLSEKVHSMISSDLSFEWSVDHIASNLFMSASTLRRKLKNEGNNIQDIRNRSRLSHGLHLLQTSQFNIGNIAELCGYQSQSRFTEQFKLLFGMTPREIRRSKMID